jgi:hypothetical protein
MMTWLQTLILIGWSVFIAAVCTAVIKLVVLASWAGRALARNGSLPHSRTKC